MLEAFIYAHGVQNAIKMLKDEGELLESYKIFIEWRKEIFDGRGQNNVM